jgi:hypothetical protein
MAGAGKAELRLIVWCRAAVARSSRTPPRRCGGIAPRLSGATASRPWGMAYIEPSALPPQVY